MALQRRHGRLGLLQHRRRASHVEVRGRADLALAHDEVVGLLGHVQRLARHVGLLGVAAEVGVGAGGLGGDGDPHRVLGGAHLFGVGVGRLYGPPQAAEQVDLVGGVKPAE